MEAPDIKNPKTTADWIAWLLAVNSGDPTVWPSDIRRGCFLLADHMNVEFQARRADLAVLPEDLVEAAKDLLNKMDLIEADEGFKSVWSLAMIHGQPYTGPTYEMELQELRDSLATKEKKKNDPARKSNI